MIMDNIFVPSKNRVNNSPVLTLGKITGTKLNVIVEPQDYDKYRQQFPEFNYMVLPYNNKGITYARNYIKEYTESNNIEHYWQLDDDITGFYYRESTKLFKSGFELLNKASEQLINNGIALGAFEYRQFAWSANKPLILNSFCDSCVFVDNTILHGLRYREYVEGKEDRDFAMQVIKAGHKTGRTTLYAFAAPPNGSNAGGLKETFYDLDKEKVCVNRMVELWGDNICIPITKENGRVDVKIIWDKINDNQMYLF